jgi:hypothetical protein
VDFEIVIAVGRIRWGTKSVFPWFPAVDVFRGSQRCNVERARAQTGRRWLFQAQCRAPEDDKVVKGEVILRVVHSKSTSSAQTQEEERSADNRFMIAAAIALALPPVIAVSLYMTATIILRAI